MEIKQPFFETDWATWVIGVGVHRCFHWTRSIKIRDVTFFAGPFTFGFAIWGKEHN